MISYCLITLSLFSFCLLLFCFLLQFLSCTFSVFFCYSIVFTQLMIHSWLFLNKFVFYFSSLSVISCTLSYMFLVSLYLLWISNSQFRFISFILLFWFSNSALSFPSLLIVSTLFYIFVYDFFNFFFLTCIAVGFFFCFNFCVSSLVVLYLLWASCCFCFIGSISSSLLLLHSFQ